MESERLVVGDINFPSVAELVVACLALCQKSRVPNISNIGVALWLQIFNHLETELATFALSADAGMKRKKGRRKDRSHAGKTPKVVSDKDRRAVVFAEAAVIVAPTSD